VSRAAAGLRLLAVLATAALGWAVVACATTAGGTQLQADLDALQQQVWKLQKDNAALAQQVAAAGTAPAGPDAALAEVKARIETMQRDIQVLRTRADENDQRLGAMTDALRATREALEALARSQSTAAVPPPNQAAPGTPGAMSPGMQAGTSAAPQAAAPGPAGAGAIGVDLYRLGYGDYAKGNYDLALAELQDFVRLNPKDDLADDAQYLIGEVYFSQQKYPEAVSAYDRLLSDHAGGDKAAAAYLKKGLALLEMNRTADAVIQLQHVVSAYPKSEEARIARERLRALGLRER
jgi:tol-pal system protein YbgF